jgi:type VI secretion system protein VasJ
VFWSGAGENGVDDKEWTKMELIELGKTPLSGDAPAGVDAKYEPEYEELTAEIGKLTSPTATGGVDWKNVQQLATQILAEKSKDILVTCYLVMSLVQNRQIEGLATGLPILKDLLENFWENLFPPKKRMRGRKNAVEWMYAQIEAFLSGFEAKPLPEEQLKAIVDSIEAVNNFLGENMEDPPYARSLQEAINMLPVQSAQEPQAAPGSASAAAAPRPAEEFVGEIESPQDAQKVINAGFKQLRLVSNYYLENDLSNPVIYTINRLAAWMPVENIPPEADGATRIPPPADQVKSVLENLYSSGDWENLLKAAETKINQFLFWLDLSRWTHESLGKLGEEYKPAQEAVARETSAFVKRLEGIENCTFSDGTPFADVDTKKWLKEISSMAAGPAGPAGPEDSADSGEAEVAEEFEKAAKLAKKRKIPEGVQLLQHKVSTASSGRSRMMWRIALVRFLLSHKKQNTAKPQIEQLLQDIETFGMMEWDPQLALEGFKVALSGLRTLNDQDSVVKANQVLDFIARIAPGEALSFEKK